MPVQPIKVLLVEDNSDYAWMLRLVMGDVYPDQFDLTHVDHLQDALNHIHRSETDVILLDLMLPDSSGFDTFKVMFAAAPDVPILVMTATDDQELATRAMREGAQDFICKGDMDIIQLVRSTQYAIERQRKVKDLKRLSLIDDLTGLLNGRGFALLAGQQLKVAERSKRSIVLLLFSFDLDQFHSQHGQDAAEQALKMTAAVLRQTFRSSDPAAYLGGGEFALLAVDAPQSSIPIMLARLGKIMSGDDTTDQFAALSLAVGTALFTPEKIYNLQELCHQARLNLTPIL